MKKIWRLTVVLLLAVCFAGCGKKAPVVGTVEFSGPPEMLVVSGKREFRGTPVRLKVKPGSYRFRFSAPGYYPRWSVVKVQPGVTNKVDVVLDPVSSAVMIDSDPRGAGVYFNGSIRGSTPLVIADLPVGEYSAQLKKKGYGEQQIRWKIVNERPLPRISAKLQMISGRLVLQSVPDAARVFIDGKYAGVTPFSNTCDAGVYKVRLEHAAFNPVEQQVTVESGKTVTLKLKLDNRPGMIRVVSRPVGAEVFLEDRKVGVTPWQGDGIVPGNYRIRLKHDGFDDWEKVISVAPGLAEKLTVVMSKTTGTAEFDIRPAGVHCLIDGKPAGTVKALANSTIETRSVHLDSLMPGEHILTVTHPRAKPVKRNIRFRIAKGRHYKHGKVISVWVSNSEVTFTDGSTRSGVISGETAESVVFSPMPGIKYTVLRKNISKIIRIPISAK